MAASTPTETVVVVAKEPAPGQAKTRLQSVFTPTETAELAGAAIRDTLRAVRATPVRHRVLSWQGFGGDVSCATRGLSSYFTVVPQTGDSLGERLADAFRRCWSIGRTASHDRPTLLIGMDTPQVRARDLAPDWGDADALLGLAPDGGFWAIGLRGGQPETVFAGVAMSTARTGAAQLARLHDLGLSVKLLPPLADVDTPDDAERIAGRYPELEFSSVHRRLTARQATAAHMFDLVYTGSPVTPIGRDDALRFDPQRWRGPADAVDAMVAARCRGPVLDLGCGPGRLVVQLLHQGIAALGVDVSDVAVRAGRDRGATALQRDLHDRLPMEGRWETVVLLDSNIGIGGDVGALLRRARDLVAPGGVVLCEVDPDPAANVVCQVSLSGPGDAAVTVPWSRAGAAAVIATAERHDLVVTEQWNAGGREFLSLTKI